MAVALALLAGCGGGGGDDGAGAPTPTSGAPSSTTTEVTTTTEGTTTTATLPEGHVKVPVDETLVERLPGLYGVDGLVAEDDTFDERLCDGAKGPSVPASQARATYVLSEVDTITIAAYRFADGEGQGYLDRYLAALAVCAEQIYSSAPIELEGAEGVTYELRTTRGFAFAAVVLRDDVLWALFHEATDGPPFVEAPDLEAFLDAVEG